jgi:hypothetical protein
VSLLLPCLCLPFKYVGHVLRIQKFLHTRNLLSIEAKSEHVFVVVGLAGYSPAMRKKLKSLSTIEQKSLKLHYMKHDDVLSLNYIFLLELRMSLINP